MQGVHAYEAAKARGERRVPGGVQVSSPGEDQPGWMRDAGEDE
jgi:hypothetical protein